MAETIDSQRQYILFLEKKVSDILGRLSDAQCDLNDARDRNEDYLSQIEVLEREIFKYEQKEQREANDGK